MTGNGFPRKAMQLRSKIVITGLDFKYKAEVQRSVRKVYEKDTN